MLVGKKAQVEFGKGVGGYFGQRLPPTGGVDIAGEMGEAGAIPIWQLMWWR